ncbi:MAG: tetratricopeptide repeat protein, partial [Candidatus Eisenbacteria bacterium]|nr:tetratricopeptide repeat protein [Candidatus Eisenbacteria bacterium]
ELWLIQANAHLAMHEEDRALEVLVVAGRLGVLRPEGLLTTGDLYYNKGLYEKAINCYDAAFETGTIGPQSALRCAEALFHVGRLDAASRYLARAQERVLDRPAEALLLGGRIAEARSDLASARKAYEATLEHDPLNGEALLALGELCWRTGDHERATLTFERASRVEGHSARALVLLAQMQVELGRYAQAVEHLEAAQEANPSRRLARYLEDVRRLAAYAEAP